MVTAAYVIITLPMVTAPFGMSHDGRNSGVFALAGRALRDLGPIDSHWGAVLAQGGGSYAHHPPLLVWLTALTDAGPGGPSLAVRLPTWLASIAVILLLNRLLRHLGCSPVAAGVAVGVVVANPMFITYAWMLDTPMLALPFFVAVLDRWIRSRNGETLSPTITALLALACGLSGWQATFGCLVLFVVGAVPWPGRMLSRSVRRASWTIGRTAVVGAGISFAWIAQSPDGLNGVRESFEQRVGAGGPGHSATVGSAIATQARTAGEVWLLATLLIAPLLAVAAWRDRRTRMALVVSSVTVIGYGLAFWQASTIHDYWHLYAVVPLALGAAATADHLMARSRHPRRTSALMIGITAGALLWVALTGSPARTELESGWAVADLIASAPIPPDQDRLPIAGIAEPLGWTVLDNGRTIDQVPGRTALADLAERHPDWQVVVGCALATTECERLVDAGSPSADGVVVDRAADIAAAFG